MAGLQSGEGRIMIDSVVGTQYINVTDTETALYRSMRRAAKNEQMNRPNPVDSMRLAVLTVSPKRQYRGILSPTTPATHEPTFDITM